MQRVTSPARSASSIPQRGCSTTSTSSARPPSRSINWRARRYSARCASRELSSKRETRDGCSACRRNSFPPTQAARRSTTARPTRRARCSSTTTPSAIAFSRRCTRQKAITGRETRCATRSSRHTSRRRST
jgi:hypothetical protein